MKPWLLISEFFPPEFGGIQSSLKIICDHFGSAVTVMTRPQPDDRHFDQAQPYRVIRRSLFSGRTRPSWGWLVGWLWRHRAEYRLTVFGHYSPAVYAAWLVSFLKRPYAILVNGQDLLSETQRFARRWLIKQTLKRAEFFGVTSDFTGRQLACLGAPRWKIVRTHPTVAGNLSTAAAESDGGLRIITACRLVPRKNVDRVIRAVARLKPEYPAIRYDIIGDGPQYRTWSDLIARLGLTEHVFLHRSVSEADKQRWLSQATVAVMTPLVRDGGSDVEGLGLFYLEAAAHGVPLIASDTGGVTDVVKHRQTGLLVDPNSDHDIARAISQMASDGKMRQSCRQAARALVAAEFSATVRNQRLAWLIDPAAVKTPPLVSVVIPVYNQADTIADTLASLARQNYHQLEIIVVNDGSTDALEPALAAWRNRLQYLTQPNQGAPVARNNGAAVARGEFLLFLDADTIIKPDMIALMVQALATHPESSFAYSNFRFGPKGFRTHDYDLEKLRQRNYIHTSALIRQADFPGFDPVIKKFQDWDLWLTMAAQGKTGIWIPRELFHDRQRHSTMSVWLPRFVYRLPLIGQGHGHKAVRRYRQAEAVIRQKHGC